MTTLSSQQEKELTSFANAKAIITILEDDLKLKEVEILSTFHIQKNDLVKYGNKVYRVWFTSLKTEDDLIYPVAFLKGNDKPPGHAESPFDSIRLDELEKVSLTSGQEVHLNEISQINLDDIDSKSKAREIQDEIESLRELCNHNWDTGSYFSHPGYSWCKNCNLEYEHEKD